MSKTNIIMKARSDRTILKVIGAYIKHHRLQQNKRQKVLAEEAGINRSTLSEFEQGHRSNTITLIRLLRSLDKLHVLEHFEVKQQLSPLMLAKLEQQKRQRARLKSKRNTRRSSQIGSEKTKSD